MNTSTQSPAQALALAEEKKKAGWFGTFWIFVVRPITDRIADIWWDYTHSTACMVHKVGLCIGIVIGLLVVTEKWLFDGSTNGKITEFLIYAVPWVVGMYVTFRDLGDPE